MQGNSSNIQEPKKASPPTFLSRMWFWILLYGIPYTAWKVYSAEDHSHILLSIIVHGVMSIISSVIFSSVDFFIRKMLFMREENTDS